MIIRYHSTFRKHFKKRITPFPFLVEKFKERFNLLLNDPTSPFLRNHRLKGQKSEYYSFSVSGDIRVIYQIKNHSIYLFDIGSHNQIY